MGLAGRPSRFLSAVFGGLGERDGSAPWVVPQQRRQSQFGWGGFGTLQQQYRGDFGGLSAS